jgi:uncharacterized Zn finger protein (UPF0148 family)
MTNLDPDEIKRVKLYPLKCSKCKANLMIRPTKKVCPICEAFPLVFREQRKYPRVRINLPLRLSVAREDVIGETKDICAGGAFIGSSKRLRTNERLSMVIVDAPPLERSLAVDAEVVQSDIYCLDDETMFHGMGVRFTRISHRDRMLLTALVEKQLRIMADMAVERKTQRNKEIFKSFADFVVETTSRRDLDKARKGQMIHEKASLLRLKFVK